MIGDIVIVLFVFCSGMIVGAALKDFVDKKKLERELLNSDCAVQRKPRKIIKQQRKMQYRRK